MRTSAPLVSIGIPTYNRKLQIERAIYSALEQDYQNIEVLVSDNASTDGTAAVCELLAAKHPNVIVRQQAQNQGPTANFMEVLDMAQGEYFMWLGDDDHIDQGYVSAAVSVLERSPLVELASGQVRYYRGGAFAFVGRHFNITSSRGWLRCASYLWRVTDNGVFYGLMRTGTVRRLRLKNVLGGDWLLLARVAMKGHIAMSQAVAVHRELGGTSDSHGVTVRILGLSKLQGIFPKVTIALNACRDVADGGFPFANSRLQNGVLATLVLALMLTKALVENSLYLAWRTRNMFRFWKPSEG